MVARLFLLGVQMQTYYQFYSSAAGKLLLIAQKQGLIGIEFEQEQRPYSIENWLEATEKSGEISNIFCKTSNILDRYFAGEIIEFSQLDFLAPIGTPFQQSVLAITFSYSLWKNH